MTWPMMGFGLQNQEVTHRREFESPPATIIITFSKPLSRRPTSPPFRASGSAKSLFLTQRSQRKLGQYQCHEAPRNPSRQPTLKHSLASNTSIVGQPCEPIQ